MPRKSIFIAFLACLAMFAAPAANAAAASPASSPASKSWSKGPIAKASCPVCVIGLGVAARAAVGVATKAVTRKGAQVVTSTAAKKGAKVVARPVLRTARRIKAGGVGAAMKVITANVRNRGKRVEAVVDCFVAGSVGFAGSGNFRAAVAACMGAAANTLRKP